MSELTRCNYCTLTDIIRRNQGKAVELRGCGEDDWVECYVEGNRVASFLKLTESCAC